MGILRRWRAKHLLLAWMVYWLLLVIVGLSPALSVIVRALNAPKGLGSISANVGNGIASLTVSSASQVWTGSVSLTALALWIAGPPLLLWLVWLVTRRDPASAREPERDYRIS